MFIQICIRCHKIVYHSSEWNLTNGPGVRCILCLLESLAASSRFAVNELVRNPEEGVAAGVVSDGHDNCL